MIQQRLLALLSGSFLRFLLVGVFNTLVGLSASFVFFNVLHLNYWLSTFAGNTLGAIVSYTLNRTFTFRSKASVGSSWWKFAIVILSCYGLSYSCSLLLAEAAGVLWPELRADWLHNGAILVGNGLYTIGNYLGHKYFTFRANGPTSRGVS
ncbi:GtrA family protein [Paenibacillus sp. CGMCC 1.16610]|uniref:GtrA family protein n=1 Tax=Paenibacillus anseongense TaxID=2682845 RepID=A0ABW9U1L3_9BACL|nr:MULTISPECIES: GtrA family protein [Paenibacillus]MBA2943404.1 GtrA family protein [Paenibacillus sp. CGMCC 1.16610]MVQ33903.1 GtrA family protein [Paenibacillus anseongense]